MATPSGPLVDDAEDAYRAILYPWQWVEHLNHPSSAAFGEEVFSVDLASRSTANETRNRFHFVLELVAFNCGEARGIGFEMRDEPDPSHPDNKAHGHVYLLSYGNLSANQRKAKARRLAMLAGVLRLSCEDSMEWSSGVDMGASTYRSNTAYLLLAAAGLIIAVRYWHGHHMAVLREQHQAGHGPIDIPEAMYFDGIAVGVQAPLLLLLVILQVAGASAFCANHNGVRVWRAARFWCLWLIAWPICIFAPLLFAP
jgi:hypothetical protein